MASSRLIPVHRADFFNDTASFVTPFLQAEPRRGVHSKILARNTFFAGFRNERALKSCTKCACVNRSWKIGTYTSITGENATIVHHPMGTRAHTHTHTHGTHMPRNYVHSESKNGSLVHGRNGDNGTRLSRKLHAIIAARMNSPQTGHYRCICANLCRIVVSRALLPNLRAILLGLLFIPGWTLRIPWGCSRGERCSLSSAICIAFLNPFSGQLDSRPVYRRAWGNGARCKFVISLLDDPKGQAIESWGLCKTIGQLLLSSLTLFRSICCKCIGRKLEPAVNCHGYR